MQAAQFFVQPKQYPCLEPSAVERSPEYESLSANSVQRSILFFQMFKCLQGQPMFLTYKSFEIPKIFSADACLYTIARDMR